MLARKLNKDNSIEYGIDKMFMFFITSWLSYRRSDVQIVNDTRLEGARSE